MGDAWIGLIGVVAGSLATSLATLLVTVMTQRGQRSEKAAAQRLVSIDRKREAFAAFMVSSLRFYNHVSALDLRDLDRLDDYRARFGVLTERSDPQVTGALEQSTIAVQLLTGERLFASLEGFTQKMLADAMDIAMARDPQFGGYSALAAPLTKKLYDELALP